MKVGLIVPGYSADSADWCIPVLVDVVRELGRRAEVHVFALRYPPRRDRYRLHGATIHTVGGGTAGGVQRMRLLAGALARVCTEHARGAFDALHGLWADEPGFVAVTAARLLGIRALVSVMGGELIALPEIAYGGQLSRWNRLLSTVALRGARQITAGSTSAADAVHRLAHVPPAAAEVLPWGVDPAPFTADSIPPVTLAGSRRILHVGSLVPIKDHHTLLQAIAMFRRTEPGVHLHLVGEGPLRAELAVRSAALGLSRHVTFHGHVDRAVLPRYYRAAHVLALSSRHEAQSVVALEATLCGLPLAGTAVGSLRDFAPNGALTVPVGDSVELARALARALTPSTAGPLTCHARRLVESGYLAAHTAQRLMSLYGAPAGLLGAG